MKTFALKEESRDTILTYLKTCPFNEVAEGCEALESIALQQLNGVDFVPIAEGLRDGLANYIASKPYGEVHRIMMDLRTLREVAEIENLIAQSQE